MLQAPECGQEYPVLLGSTFSNDDVQDTKEYVSLRYRFIPNSVSRATTGILTLEQTLQDGSQAKGNQNPIKVYFIDDDCVQRFVVPDVHV